MTDFNVACPFVGDWTYRSFLNLSDPIPNTDTALLSVILFGQGEISRSSVARWCQSATRHCRLSHPRCAA